MAQWHPTTTINTLLPEAMDEVGISVVVTFVIHGSDIGITRNEKNKTFSERDVFTGPSPQANVILWSGCAHIFEQIYKEDTTIFFIRIT